MNITFNYKTASTLDGVDTMEGVIDGKPIRAQYDRDYDWDGERWNGGASLIKVESTADGETMMFDEESRELVNQELQIADQDRLAHEAGYR